MSGGRTPRRMVYVPRLIALLSPAIILAPAAAQERAPVPGEVDTHVTQATIRATICESGYTAKVRPPRKFTDAIKRRLVNGLPGSSQDYELDHLIPLGLGGHPTSANNLWVQVESLESFVDAAETPVYLMEALVHLTENLVDLDEPTLDLSELAGQELDQVVALLWSHRLYQT